MELPHLGIGVLGCGAWGYNHVRVWRDMERLIAVCDQDPARLAQVGDLDPRITLLDDVDQLIHRDDIDGVVVATPAATHAELALRALEAGKDVLVEKPLATSLSDAEKVVEVAERNGAILAVGHVLEYHPAVLKLRQLIGAGALGKVLYMYSNRLNLGRVRTEENALWSFAPHDVALLLRLTGRMPVRVAAQGGEYLNDGVADVTLMSLDFPDSLPAHVFVSWLHPFKEHRFVVVGDEQMAVFDDTSPWKDKLLLFPHKVDWVDGRVPVAKRADASAVPLEEREPLRSECQKFLESIATREQPLTDGPSGVRVLRVLEAGQRSLDQSGMPVQILETASRSVAFRHPTSSVSPDAEIGPGTKIWHYTHVMGGARIGKACILGQNVFVARGAIIGNGVKLQNNVSVYEGVELDDLVFCGPSVVFTNVSNPRSEIERKAEFRRTIVRRGATLGANSTILCGVTVGRYAFVAAGAVVTKDVPDHALVVGVPARHVGWICSCGERLPEMQGDPRCSACGRSFERSPDGLVEVEQANIHSETTS